MKPTIKTLMMVSILLLAVICVCEAAYAQPRDKAETGFNLASRERAGPILTTENVFATDSFDFMPYKTSADVVALTRRTPQKFDKLNSPINTASATREAYVRRCLTRAAGYVLRV